MPIFACFAFRQEGLGCTDLKEKLKDRLVYPMDLASLEYCITNDLRFSACQAFYDQEAYNDIFAKVVSVLMDCMYDKKLFNDYLNDTCPEVNLLFVPMYQLVALYGGALLKIYELHYIADQSRESNCAILEELTDQKKHIPVVDYVDIARHMFPDTEACFFTKAPCAPTSSPSKNKLPDRESWKGLRMRTACCAHNLLLRAALLPRWSRKTEVSFVHDVIDLGSLRKNARSRQWISRIKTFYFDKKRSGEGLVIKPFLEPVLPTLTSRVVSRFDFIKDATCFLNLVKHIYKQYYYEIERAPASIIRRAAGSRSSSSCSKYLFVRSAVRPAYRAFIYGKYLEGYKIVTQEYADGPGNGASDNTVFAYKAAPVSEISLYTYDTYLGPAFHYIKEQGCRNNTLEMHEVGPFLKNHQADGGPPGSNASRSPRRIYYLPDTYSKKSRIGTNRELNDLVYWDIQQRILGVLTRIDNAQIIFKAHPKGFYQRLTDYQRDYLKDRGIIIMREPIDNLMQDIDVVVSERFGSGLYKCLHSFVPVVYLHFGSLSVDRFFDEFKSYLQKRVVWIEASLQEGGWKDALKQAIADILKHEPRQKTRDLHPHPLTGYKGAGYILDVIEKHKEKIASAGAGRAGTSGPGR